MEKQLNMALKFGGAVIADDYVCLLYTSDAADE